MSSGVYKGKISNSEFRKGKIPYIMTDIIRGKIKKALKGNKNASGKHHELSEAVKKKRSEIMLSYFDRIGRKKYKLYKHVASKEQKEWRMKVFLRDNFTCQFCGVRGNQTGGYLEAHHIKGWTKYPKLRYEVNNGITLCKKCHKLAHKVRK